MDTKRKRSSWEDNDLKAAHQVKKQRNAPAVVDLTLSSPPPEELSSSNIALTQTRVDSEYFAPKHKQSSKSRQQPNWRQSQNNAVNSTGSDRAPISHPQPDGKKKNTKFYAVAKGHTPGIYTDWTTAEQQVRGYSFAVHQSFRTKGEAEDYIAQFTHKGYGIPQHMRVETSPTTATAENYRGQSNHSQAKRAAIHSSIRTNEVVAKNPASYSTGSNEDAFQFQPGSRHLPMIATERTYHPVAGNIAPGRYTYSFDDDSHEPLPNGGIKTEPKLCEEQHNLVDLIMSGRNVFYTGSAGCGKSTVLKAFVKQLKQCGRNVVIVAPTGKAALEINGSTYFTFAGWTPDHFKKPLRKLREGAHQTFVNKRMRAVDTLIIDEISMMENHAFERLNEVMKEARGSGKAFGGVQLVVTGDFCQLPPVKPFKFCMECGRETKEKMGGTVFTCPMHGDFLELDKWAFRSQAWKECNFSHVNLTTIHRQKDRKFIDILERCRMGKQLAEKERDLLLHHDCEVQNAVRLFSTREEVRRLNYEEYSKLKTEARKYNCYDDIKVEDAHPHLKWKATRLPDGSLVALKEQKFDTCVELKEGMRVVLQANLNIDQGLVNGSQGVVVGWETYDENRLPKADKSRGKRTEPPPLNAILGEHAVYREKHIKAFIETAQVKEWPVIEFENGIRRTIFAECIVSELGDTEPYTLMSRTQIPLLAGWAMTVHKSQGMTLTKVEIDLGRAFEEGQMYVALSRARSLDGMKVRSLGQWTGSGNVEVMQFLQEQFGIGA